jgi:hypothetical protein
MALGEKWRGFHNYAERNQTSVQILWSEEMGEVERLISFAEAPGLAWWVRRSALSEDGDSPVVALRIWFN